MQARFATFDFGDEAASMQAAAEGRIPEEAYHLWGRIVLDHPGQPTVAVLDDLSMLGLALCVRVPADIVRAGRAELHLVGSPVEFTFVAKGDAVRLTGSMGEDATFPRDELLVALHACGLRLAAFMDKLSVAFPGLAFSSRALAENLAKAT
ncbi:MAG TPA: hypothetical protein VNX28_12365 [Gemmataceae bacterium]|nr:hypothetical protein [Gemmataceae bacterium]